MSLTLAPQIVVDLFQVQVDAVEHVRADLGERPGRRRDETDAQLFLRRGRHASRRKGETNAD
jgi:hypothetical protein